ncbi:MAG: Rieske 2Fe-2S domain-containing protein [Chloroflexota bacterium]
MADVLDATVDAMSNVGETKVEVDPEVAQRRVYNRREFMVYTFAAASGLLLAEVGAVTYFFLYPRFREGEFGGDFVLEGDLPPFERAPIGNPDGKFWLVTTEEGETKAIYMVCTHLGCLYKWVEANWRFECPCHGSKFTHDGLYIEGPAPRSLDSFEIVTRADGTLAAATGSKITGSLAAESPARRIIE